MLWLVHLPPAPTFPLNGGSRNCLRDPPLLKSPGTSASHAAAPANLKHGPGWGRGARRPEWAGSVMADVSAEPWGPEGDGTAAGRSKDQMPT